MNKIGLVLWLIAGAIVLLSPGEVSKLEYLLVWGPLVLKYLDGAIDEIFNERNR